MFDAPIDAWYVWLGVALASTVAFGLATAFPTAPPPDAAAVADAVDTVAASDHAGTAEVPLTADAIKLAPGRVSLRADGATAHATFVYGPVTPVRDGTLLWEVLQGAPPEHVFDSVADFRQAVRVARDRPPEWEPANERLVARRLTWEGIDVTLVDA